MTASCTNYCCLIQIVFWMRLKKQHCSELLTKQKLHNNKENYFRYFIVSSDDGEIPVAAVEAEDKADRVPFQSYHDCMKTQFRPEGLPLYIWRWFVCYKCSLNGYNVRRHITAMHGQEASVVTCDDCDATFATNTARALGKQFTSGNILKQNMTRTLTSLKFRLVHTTVVISFTLPSANMIWKVMLWKNIVMYSWVFRVMSGVWKIFWLSKLHSQTH